MENNKQNKIDELFQQTAKETEEIKSFPAFEKVWEKVEQKLDEEPKKKNRIFPLWFPYGIAAGLALALGSLYLFNKNENVKPTTTIAKTNEPKPGIPENSSSLDNDEIEELDRQIKTNIEKNPAEKKNEIIAYHDVKDRKSDYSTDEYFIEKKDREENPPIITKHLETTDYVAPPPPPTTGTKSSTVESVKKSDEKVVTAIGIKGESKKKGYSSELVSKTLSGKVAGLNIVNNANPGSTPNIVIRGVSSIDTSESPLDVVDGKIYKTNVLGTLSPDKIFAVNVLKNGAATALYGNKGRNGVVVIETKNLSNSEKRKLEKDLKSDDAKETLKPEKVEEPETDLPTAGQLTAGEINDFSKWDYWQDIAVPVLQQYKNTWKFFPDRRVSVQLLNQDKKPVIGQKVVLLNDKKEEIWSAVSDNLGNAELWISPRTDIQNTSQQFYLADDSGRIISDKVKEFKDGQNLIYIHQNCLQSRNLELAFVVDATGSMGDEISYLQSELLDVLKKVESNLQNTKVNYGSVFYRDKGDEYLTRKFDFSEKAEDLISFIKKQKAAGGGDTPEAVVEALEEAIDGLKWSDTNSAKLMFLILDAPPHWSEENINRLFEKIKLAAQKGITIIPLAASDTDKQTEYLMRTFALLTNGTYTFLTNDSGIGNNHIEPTASEYEVEKLNDLILRIILQRSSIPDCENGIENEYLNKKLDVESRGEKNFTVKIFPNPTKGNFKIQSVAPIDEFDLYDYTGKVLLKKEKLPKGINEFDISVYPQSVYIIRLKYGNIWETFKIIKN